MKILHVITCLGAGGAERVLITLMREQLRRKHTVFWCALGGGETQIDGRRDVPSPEVFDFSFSTWDFQGRGECSRRFRNLLKSVKPDVIHSHLWPASRFVESQARRENLPHVVHVQDTRSWLTDRDWRSCRDRIVTRFRFRRQLGRTRFLAVSEATEAATRESLQLQSAFFCVVRNPLDPVLGKKLFAVERNQQKSRRPLRVGMAARLTPEKGHAELLHAAAQMCRNGTPVECRFAGSGSHRTALKMLASQLGLQDGRDFKFVGECTNIEQFFNEIDIFVLPSLSSEGLSIAQLEAMASGLPVVVTDVAGAKEAARDGVEGFVVTAGDRGELATALTKLISSPDLRLRMGANGRDRVARKFTAEKMADEVDDVYQELLPRPWKR